MMRSTTRKPIVVDHTIAAVGTGNLTKKYYATSPDAYILTTSTSDVAAIAATFDTHFTDEHLASECPFGHRVGGCAIHLPAVVCANSPSTTTSLCVGRRRRD